MRRILYFILCIFCVGCTSKPYSIKYDVGKKAPNNLKLFTLVSNEETRVDFSNEVKETEELNFLNFGNIYNGGGVATADFNNDGLVDIFFTANQQSNKLYLNEGDFQFKDITNGSGIEDHEGWTTGVSVIDINNDGWLDIYICKSGELRDNSKRDNKLFINQKNNTFVDKAKEWRINDPGFSTQSYFFDFDRDGDLDMYLVNHRPDFENSGRLNMRIEKSYSRFSSDILYRNDGAFFTDITHKAGIVNKAWGLSASIGDFNGDNWPDVYVCNDFLTPDMLYVNNKNGTFTNQVLKRMNHISYSSMGSDYADLNNDLLPDLLVLEMASEDHIRSKKNMATMSTGNFNALVENKYHHQYMVNTLQLNQGGGNFSEVAQMTGLAKTDWSWAPLIADFDNDGLKDVFVTNGILKDMANQDFRTELGKKFSEKDKPSFKEITDLQPSTKLSNYSYKNQGNLEFLKTSKEWGLSEKTQSNGAAYADFDNDGDLDLVINNINDIAHIYKNNSTTNFLQINLIAADAKNRFALGSKVTISVGGSKQYQELYMSRGFISSVQNVVNFGVGNATIIDEVKIEWPNQEVTILNNVEANQIISVNQEKSEFVKDVEKQPKRLYAKIDPVKKGISYKHIETRVDDFKNQVLLPHSQSSNGPFIDKADVNGDGLEDFYVGGAANQSGELYLQMPDGNFKKLISDVWEKDKAYEDLGVLFFDADNDNDLDLYVVSGSSEFTERSSLFQDRLYINNGKGNYVRNHNALPKITSSGQSVVASDVDGDGDLDLFVGGRVIPDKYPLAPESYILINENGKFYNRTDKLAPTLSNIGMVTDAIFSDYDNDGDDDLILVGEWMSITVFKNTNGKFQQEKIKSLEKTKGLWFSIEADDIDGDGDVDYFCGNLGLNAKFKVDNGKEFHIFCDDFDNSGTYDIVLSNKYKGVLVPARGKECSTQQMPFVSEKFLSYGAFAEASLADVYGEENLENALHHQAEVLESMFIENIGNGEFKLKMLPRSVQISPIMDFEFLDIDKDNTKEIIVVGNHYNTEVETVRYDASFGAVLSYDSGKFQLLNPNVTGVVNKGNAKDVMLLNRTDNPQIIVSNNNGALQMFEVN